MRKANAKPEEWQSKLGTRHFNPLEVMEMQDALRERKKSVIISGRKFSLEYSTVKGEQRVFYKLATGDPVPCGYLDVERFLKEL